jgi:hypothetical protein
LVVSMPRGRTRLANFGRGDLDFTTPGARRQMVPIP